MKWAIAGGMVGLAAVLVGLAVTFTAPQRGKGALPPADSPDELITSVFTVVDQRRPDRLTDLIYAASPEMRAVLDRMGVMFGNVQSLAIALQERFPAEVERLKASAQEGNGPGVQGLMRAAQQGAANAQAQQGGRGNRGGARGGSQPGGEFVAAVLADPYGWITRARDRVTTVEIAADAAAVLVDKRPAFGLGLTLRKDQGRWWIDLPLQIPQVAKYTPQSPEEFMILGSMVQALDNAVVDLTADVKAGKAGSLEEASRLAGEKAFGPMVMCFIAYDRAMKARQGGAR